jgi:hypothetical protein
MNLFSYYNEKISDDARVSEFCVTKIKEDVNMLLSHFCTVHSIVTTITSIVIIVVPISIQSGEGTEPPRKHNSWKNVEVTPHRQ